MVNEILSRYPLKSDQLDERELRVILENLHYVIEDNIQGDVVELGCYEGVSSVYLERLIEKSDCGKTLHVYDSFEGLPDKTKEDNSGAGEQFKKGELLASKGELIKRFKQADIKTPRIHKNWFSNLSDKDLPDEISFAFLDGDYYQSIKDSFRLIESKLKPGAAVIVDDYISEALPGAAKATDEWRDNNQNRVATFQAVNSLAIIRIQ